MVWGEQTAIDSHGRGRKFEPCIAHHHFKYLENHISFAKLGMCSKLCSFGRPEEWSEERLERGKFEYKVCPSLRFS